MIEGLLHKFNKYNYATITTDLGGELSKSFKFQNLVRNSSYILTPTGPYASTQNGLAEKPNQDLANIMRCLLYGAGLSSKIWTYALRHSVYLKNKWPHSSLNWMTPYEAVNKHKPDLRNLCIFSSIVHTKISQKCDKKLDLINHEGLFMTYCRTEKLTCIVDKDGRNERTSTHFIFDKAHISTKSSQRPPMADALYMLQDYDNHQFYLPHLSHFESNSNHYYLMPLFHKNLLPMLLSMTFAVLSTL